MNIYKFALLWGEAQLCLPYVCLLSRLLTAPTALPANAAAAEVPQADEKAVHDLCRKLLRCTEQPSVTCWPAQDPEGEPPDPQPRQGRQEERHQGRQEGLQGRGGQHQGARRAQGLQRRHPEIGEGSEARDQVRFLC